MRTIEKVAVIGAGTMGSGIASHLANADISVRLLDIVPEGSPGGSDARNALARGAVERQRTASPPGFVHESKVALIEPGNIEDHLALIADADWIVEAIVERLESKRALYERIEAVRKKGSMVSSNTSTIPLELLVAEMPASFKADFCITHFFNPVRYMRLLELVPGEETAPEVIETLDRFCDYTLGKGVVRCKDTPGFLGNRVGVYALQVGMTEAATLGLEIEEADLLMGRPMGIPKTGVFALYDLIGLDLMLDVVASLVATLPPGDAFHRVAAGLDRTRALVEAGHKGRKTGAGFFRVRKTDTGRVSEAVDLDTGTYRPARRPELEAARLGEVEGLRALVECDDIYGRFAWRVLAQVLTYAASIVPEASDDIVAIDEAMKLGYGWTHGPMEMIDALGVAYFRERLERDGLDVPPLLASAGDRPLYRPHAGRIEHLDAAGDYHPLNRPPGVIRIADVRRLGECLEGNAFASVWDLGDGVLGCEFHSKANALSPDTMTVLARAVELAGERDEYRALVVGNDAAHFSVGFNIDFVLRCCRAGDFDAIRRGLEGFHDTCMALRYATVPVVASAAGMALGGGYEVVMHCDAAIVHSNSVLGLVEPMVGVVPSGGGCKELLARWTLGPGDDPLAGAVRTYAMIMSGTTAGSPEEAGPLRLLGAADVAIMNRDRMLGEAKRLALALADGYRPRAPLVFQALGEPGRAAMRDRLARFEAAGLVVPHDHTVGERLAWVLSGGDAATGTPVAETEMLALERDAFLALARTPETQARIAHMLETGQALRN